MPLVQTEFYTAASEIVFLAMLNHKYKKHLLSVERWPGLPKERRRALHARQWRDTRAGVN